jgi:hypothetical protein
LAFLAYAWAALKYLAEYHPEVEKLDFVVEKKTTITQHVRDFHTDLPLALAALDNPELARLVGRLIPDGKERLPLQAADLLCWHCARREKPRTMTPEDVRRYRKLTAHKGIRIPLKKRLLKTIKAAFVS